jgi:hypothetical protein
MVKPVHPGKRRATHNNSAKEEEHHPAAEPTELLPLLGIIAHIITFNTLTS